MKKENIIWLGFSVFNLANATLSNDLEYLKTMAVLGCLSMVVYFIQEK